MARSNTIVLKRTNVPGKIPSTLNLTKPGEVAVNLADNKLFVRNTTDQIVELTSQPIGNASDVTITSPVDGQVLRFRSSTNEWESSNSLRVQSKDGTVSVDNTEVLKFDQNTGLKVTDLGDHTVEISIGSHWKNLEVDGESTLIPIGEETLRFIAGTGLAIKTDSSTAPKSIEFIANEPYLNALQDVVLDHTPPVNGEILKWSNNAWRLSTGVDIQRFDFGTPSFTWNITHNQGTDQFIERIVRGDGMPMFANIDVTDLNNFKVYFTEEVTGHIDVIFSG
jgi:hypothetical protein